jgi:hypothetical protein
MSELLFLAAAFYLAFAAPKRLFHVDAALAVNVFFSFAGTAQDSAARLVHK